MIPRTYPSTFNSIGESQMVIYVLGSVIGMVKWIDYIPVKWSTDPLGRPNSYDTNGFVNTEQLSSFTGKASFVDYIPVYVDNAATKPWSTDDSGYIPIGGGSAASAIAVLYAAGEQGAWYDPSDWSTLFQDRAGTTPVTTVGQPVGLMLDKRLGLVLGVETLVNGDFSAGATGWTAAGTTLAIESQRLRVTNVGAVFGQGYKNATGLTAGKTYRVSGEYWASPGATPILRAAGVAGADNIGLVGASGLLSFVFTALGATQNIALINTPAADGVSCLWDNISVRELPGSHVIQPTTTKRPLFQSPPVQIVYDGIDDALVTTFPASLGSSCTICRAIPGVGASILTGQTIGASYSDSTSHAGLIVINRALTTAETASVTAYLNAKAGV